MSSLRAHEALYHVSFKIIQRSGGRSAVAAAAYRAGEQLEDRRTGRTFDYSQKSEVADTFISAPTDAPNWTQDRGELWSRVELSERRKDSQTARELEISLPRDVPAAERRALIEDVVRPYIDAGAVADVCIHAPQAADGKEQPHAHILLTPRTLDASTEHGFAATKNRDLAAFFEGRDRKAGIRQERERIANVVNDHLRRCESARRVDHRSYTERGDDRQPEPKFGEPDMQRFRRAENQKLSARQQRATLLRQTKITENQIINLETQSLVKGVLTMPEIDKKQEVKRQILMKRFPDFNDSERISDAVHMIDAKQADRLRIQTQAGGWIEYKGGNLKTWGPQTEHTRELSRRLADAAGIEREEVKEIRPLAKAEGPESAGFSRKKERESAAEWWRSEGYTDVTESGKNIWISLGDTRICDSGNRLTVYGQNYEDAAKALCAKAEQDWNSRMEIRGDERFKQTVWLEAQRQGIEIINYDPPPQVKAIWEREQSLQNAAGPATDEGALDRIKAQASLARQARDYAAGNRDTLGNTALKERIDAMPDEEKSAFANSSNADVISAMNNAGEPSDDRRQDDDEERTTPSPNPDDDHPASPVPEISVNGLSM